ncbi:hypothetical protein C8F04DRAFT_1114976, partial [Mycena alexandri]
MPGTMAERGSPVSPTRTVSIRKLTRILRPGRTRAAAQPSSLSIIPGSNGNGLTPPSSPSIYSLSSDNDSRQHLSEISDRPESRPPPLLSPASSTFSSSVSEGHGDGRVLRDINKRPVDRTTADLSNGRAGLVSPAEQDRKSKRVSADYAWAMNRAPGARPRPIIITDQGDSYIDDDAASLRRAGNWTERGKLEPLSPSEWIGGNILAKKAFLGVTLSTMDSENRRPLAASCPSSPVTPRPRPVSVYANLKPGWDLDPPLLTSGSHTTLEYREPALLTGYHRRPRSASEPRSFLRPRIDVSQHTGTVPSTLTEYILPVPALEASPKSSASSVTILPSPRRSSLPRPKPMQDDVYFTAAGRPESRMYISADAAPNYVPVAPIRPRHAHTNSESVLSSGESTGGHHFPHKSEPSGRPFENYVAWRDTSDSPDGVNTPVSRKEEMWSGNWNREDIQDVIRELRSL